MESPGLRPTRARPLAPTWVAIRPKSGDARDSFWPATWLRPRLAATPGQQWHRDNGLVAGPKRFYHSARKIFVLPANNASFAPGGHVGRNACEGYGASADARGRIRAGKNRPMVPRGGTAFIHNHMKLL